MIIACNVCVYDKRKNYDFVLFLVCAKWKINHLHNSALSSLEK